MTIDWTDVLKISASSSILTSVIGWGLNYHFIHRAELRRDAQYLAIRLAIVLEKFAIDCSEMISENSLHNQSKGSAGSQKSSLPAIGSFPADADWNAVDVILIDRVLSLPNQRFAAEAAIVYWWNVVGNTDEMYKEADCQAGVCGLASWTLAADLRDRYGAPKSSLPTDTWDFVTILKEQSEASAKRRSENEIESDADLSEAVIS